MALSLGCLALSGSLSAPFLRPLPVSAGLQPAGSAQSLGPAPAPARSLPAAPGESGPAVAARALRGDSELDG